VLSPPGARALGLDLPWATQSADCDTDPMTVVLAVHPEAADLVGSILAPLQETELPQGECLVIETRSEDPQSVLSASALLPAGRAPQIWIPDSSLWAPSLTNWSQVPSGSLGFTPVVLATGPAALESLEWQDEAPRWEQALTGDRPVVVPDVRASGTALMAYLALWNSLGADAEADRTVAATALNASRIDPTTARAALENDPDAPILVTTEAAVVAANRDGQTPRLVAIYPPDTAVALDYPILKVAPAERSTEMNAAVDLVLARLTSTEATALAHQAGLRDALGTSPGGTGIDEQTLDPPASVSGTKATAFLSQLRGLQTPNRILTVMDVSMSMNSVVPATGASRIELARRAATITEELLSDSSSVGLWIFALDLDGELPYLELSPVDQLDLVTDGQTHRERINADLATLPNRLSGNGTGLYSTAVAAMTEMQSHYRANANNSVVLFTDGTSENDPSYTRDEAVKALTELYDPQRPVRLITIGIGPGADLESLRALTAPSGGEAYLASSSDEFQEFVLTSLTRTS
jgi:hypothetical protein